MNNFYIYQVGHIIDINTYKKLDRILKLRGVYYNENIQNNIISLLDSLNKYITKAIEYKIDFSSFNPDYVSLAISRNITPFLLPKEKMNNALTGEVQVLNNIGEEFIEGLIIPLDIVNCEQKDLFIVMMHNLCLNNRFELPIYDYDGECLLKVKKKIRVFN